MYAHIKKAERGEHDKLYGLVKLVCTFINPELASKMFTEKKMSDSENFLSDISAMDPHFDPSKYEDVLQD